MTLAEIQRAIEELPEEEQRTLAAWVAERDQLAWDAQIERDFSPGGPCSALSGAAGRQVKSGRSKPFSQGVPIRVIGKTISVIGRVCWWVCGVLGFLISLGIVHAVTTNFWVFALAFFLFPVTIAAAPWYALFYWGTWIPLAVTYGGFIASVVLRAIGHRLNPAAEFDD